jgi:hypothetical protein
MRRRKARSTATAPTRGRFCFRKLLSGQTPRSLLSASSSLLRASVDVSIRAASRAALGAASRALVLSQTAVDVLAFAVLHRERAFLPVEVYIALPLKRRAAKRYALMRACLRLVQLGLLQRELGGHFARYRLDGALLERAAELLAQYRRAEGKGARP